MLGHQGVALFERTKGHGLLEVGVASRHQGVALFERTKGCGLLEVGVASLK